MTDRVFATLWPRFTKMYSDVGRPSIPPEQLLRALLMQPLASSAHPRNSGGSPPAANGGIRDDESLQVMSGKSLIAVRKSGRIRRTRKAASANSRVIGHRATGVGTGVSYNVRQHHAHTT
jgi:hypothetical protein